MMDLDIMEACSVLSSLGTLAIALTSWYQIRRDARIGYVPMVVIDDFARWNGHLIAEIRNYGTGPALDLRMWMVRGRDVLPIEPSVNGRRVTGLHLAPTEAKRVQLEAVARESASSYAVSSSEPLPAVIRMRYRSVRGRTFEGQTHVPPELG
ncbi:hypothetical protein [Alicyclobacillus vulcanalis]|nr:hypothetical protein [Alicyclobacillus vulcanalis]